MKLTEMGDVTDLGKFRDEKREKQIADTNQKIQQAKGKQFNAIDLTVAATIDRLAQTMSFEDAEAATYKHLSDIVMMYDMEKGQ